MEETKKRKAKQPPSGIELKTNIIRRVTGWLDDLPTARDRMDVLEYVTRHVRTQLEAEHANQVHASRPLHPVNGTLKQTEMTFEQLQTQAQEQAKAEGLW